MSVQTAYYNQPYANPAAGQGWTQVASIPISQYLNGMETPGMTQMPNVPQPPFMNNTANPSSGLAPMPNIPSPLEIAPYAMGLNSGMPAYNVAQSVPVSTYSPYMDPLTEIPPPHHVAPWLYFQRPANPMPPYANPNLNAQNPMQGPQQPPQQPPTPPPQPQPKGPTAELDGGALSDHVINSLNERLNSASEDVRADASMDLFKILDTNRGLIENPIYAKYIHAFTEKIMADPSPVVRGGGELILEMGLIPQPTDNVKKQLKKLSQRTGLTGEDGITGGILGSIEGGTLRKSKSPSSTTVAAPAATPAAGTPPAGAEQQAPPMGMPSQGGAQPDLASMQSQPAGMPGYPGASSPYGMQQPMLPQQAMAGQDYPMQQPMPPQQAMAGQGYPMQQAMFPQQAMPGQGYPMQQAPQQQPWGAPPMFSGNSRIGSRLNLVSSQNTVPMAPVSTTGRRLNIQEGY